MSATPRIYKYTDANAPAPTDRYSALYEILKACLVDGYGSQPAAGWSMVYDTWSTDGLATFTNAAQSGVLGIVAHTSNSYGCAIFCADAMVDATSPVTARTTYQQITDVTALVNSSSNVQLSCYNTSSTWGQWVVVANENVAVVFLASSDTYLFTSPSFISGQWLEVMIFGSAQSLRGLGSISNASVGNFGFAGRYNSYNVQSFDSGGYATWMSDESGAVVSGSLYSYLYPYGSGSGASWGYSSDDSIVELDLKPLEVWGSTSSGSSNAKQLARWPMILTTEFFGTSGRYYTDRLSTLPLSELITAAGKSCYVVLLPENNRALLSMELEDWI